MNVWRTGLIRLGGLAAIVGGIAFVATTLSLGALANRLGLGLDDESVAPIYALLPLVAMVALVSIAALYVREGQRRGWLALVASLVSFIGIGMVLVYVLTVLQGLLDFTVTEEFALLGVLLATVGLVALGLVTINMGALVLPWWCGVALIVGSPPFAFLGRPLGGVLLGGAWTLVGYALFRAGTHRQMRPSWVR